MNWQILDEKTILEIFPDGFKRQCKPTDFAILLGARLQENGKSHYLVSTANNFMTACAIHANGDWGFNYPDKRDVPARPALPFSEIYPICPSAARAKVGEVFEFNFEYPQSVASKKISAELERNYIRLKRTGKSYTVDSVPPEYTGENYTNEFTPRKLEEVEYNGKKYVRLQAFAFDEYSKIIRDGLTEVITQGKFYFVEVEKVKFLRLKDKSGREYALTVQSLFAGVQFDLQANFGEQRYTDGAKIDISKHNIGRYLKNDFARDIEQSLATAKGYSSEAEFIPEQRRKTRIERINPDLTPNHERRRMTDSEIIKNWIDSGESVLLRGPSGIGKTERIKQMYPDLIYIKLTNNMFPEKVVGSMNLQTGQAIPPDFAKHAIMAGATPEEREQIKQDIQKLYDIADQVYERSKTSQEKIVIMLDELLNVKLAVQSLVYTLVLNKMLEIGKGVKLPQNTVVVGTGNQKKFSSVAEDLAEPLEKRFDHILDMEPKVGEWVYEYAIPQQLHPSVISYIFLKYQEKNKSEEISDMGYFYEEPEVGEAHLDKNGCRGRTNDPRGWAAISKILCNYEENLKKGQYKGKDPDDILRRTIHSKLREEWAEEFYDFYNYPTISVDDIMSNSYSQADLPQDSNERFATMAGLLSAKVSQIGKVREFVEKHCDKEYLTVFDMYWAGTDEQRAEKLSEISLMKATNHEGDLER